MAPEWRIEFDAEVVFSNGGALQTQGFRLDIPGADISDEELAELLIRHLGLLMVGAVTFTRKTFIQEPHKGSRGVESASGTHRVIDLGEATLDTADAGLAGLVDLPGIVVRVLGGSSVIDRAALAPFEVKDHAVVLHGGGLTEQAAAVLAEQGAALVATGAGAHLVVRDPTCLTPLRPTAVPVRVTALSESPNTVQYEDFPPPCQEPRGSTADARQQDHAPLAGIPVITGLTGLDSLPPNNFRLHAVPFPTGASTSCRIYAIAT